MDPMISNSSRGALVSCTDHSAQRLFKLNTPYVNTSPVSPAHHLFGPFKEKINHQYKSEKEQEERENYFIYILNDYTMWLLLPGFVLLVCAADATQIGGRTVPDFGKMYHVKGELSLPHSEIKEPFEAWYDLEGNRSRIDYRNGTVRTFLTGNDLDYGVIYKITPVTTETEIQAIKCFQLKGTKEDPIRPQAALPDLQDFEFEKMENYTGVLCEVWKKVTQVGHKKNTYRLWVTRPEGNDSPATPHRFEMVGFNTLLESHNDKYTIDYSDFSPQTESDIFKPPVGMTCGEFPDPVEEHQILANPIQDYVNTSPVSHAHRLFGPFKEKFNRQYKSEKEHEERENYFIHTQRFVHSTNRAGLTFSVGINDFADWTKAELARLTGGIPIPNKEKDVTK